MSRGSRHLLILGLAIVIFALSTTAFSLALYHNSGDIYLDRSRPGFLPDADEKGSAGDSYRFPESGAITPAVLEDYLRHLDTEINRLDALGDPFSADVLSDESLGIGD